MRPLRRSERTHGYVRRAGFPCQTGLQTVDHTHNGFTPKTVASEIGDIQLDVPRDRGGSFTPRVVPKGARRLGGLDDMIIC